ncbi:hypothetical protein ACLOJK_004474, partial [Asimina triloba]
MVSMTHPRQPDDEDGLQQHPLQSAQIQCPLSTPPAARPFYSRSAHEPAAVIQM